MSAGADVVSHLDHQFETIGARQPVGKVLRPIRIEAVRDAFNGTQQLNRLVRLDPARGRLDFTEVKPADQFDQVPGEGERVSSLISGSTSTTLCLMASSSIAAWASISSEMVEPDSARPFAAHSATARPSAAQTSGESSDRTTQHRVTAIPPDRYAVRRASSFVSRRFSGHRDCVLTREVRSALHVEFVLVHQAV